MAKNWITPTPVKFELRAYGEVYDLSNCIENWKDLEFTQKRDETSGIFHQISFPFEFVLDAYDIVKNIFDTHKYRAVGDMYIYLLKDNWPYVEEQYHEPQIFNLDWTTYNKSDSKIEIDTKRTSLYDFVKAKNKIVYDIPVDAIKESKQWDYERIELENILTELVSTEFNHDVQPKEYIGDGTGYRLGLTYKGSEISVPDKIIEQTLSDFTGSDDSQPLIDSWFLTTADKLEDSIDINISGNLHIPIINIIDRWDHFQYAYIGFFKKKDNEDLNPIESSLDGINVTRAGTHTELKHKFDINIRLDKGDKLYFIIWIKGIPNYEGEFINVNFGEGFDFEFKVSYKATPDREEYVDLIDPKTLLQSLVNKMTESKSVYVSDIEDFNTDKNNLIMMSAAESIRGIQKTDTNEPKVHTSYRQFVEWMNTYGYEQHIVENKLTFRKRHKGFRSDLTAIELGEKECAGLREYVNEDFLYTGLKIGYNRKDIENINGRFEFNGIHDYSTDLNTGDNILELISPYRADCYGIEFLTQERGKDSTDDKSDKDLFLVNVSEIYNYYITVRHVFSGNYPNETLFNGNLNPYNLMKLNESLLGVSVDKVSFAGSDSNSKIVIDGQAIDASYDIPKGIGLFEPIIYDIASKNIQHLPSGENVNGLIRFHYKGNVYEGFIEEVSKNPAWETETTWILYKKR